MKTLKSKIMMGGILLLTVFLAVLLPFGKVHAQTHTTELSDYDRISGGDILNVSSYGSISGLKVLCYRGGDYFPDVDVLYTDNYTMPTLPSGSMWKFYGVQTNSLDNYKYLYFREVRDISILEEAYVVNVNGEYYSPDPSSLYTVSFPDGSTKEIPGNGTMVSFSATQLGVRSIEGKTIHLDVPRDASALRPGDKIKKGDLIYSPRHSDIYTLVYYDPTDPTGSGRRTSTTNITGKYHQVKFTSGSNYDKDEWSVTSTTSVNISDKYIYLDEPAPLGPNASPLKAEDLLREGDQLTARVRGGINNPWYFIYRNPDNSADSIREEIITDYTVTNAYGREEWTVVETDASDKCIYAEANETPEPEPERGPGPCHHEFEWETQIEPTETTAGLMYNKCTKCGYVAQTLETSGYPVFCENTVKAIRAAEVNAAVKVDTNIWTSFTQPVIDALAARPDVTLNVIYKYEGKYYTTTLPAGADLTGLVNEDGYCGFRYLDQVFGGSEVVR